MDHEHDLIHRVFGMTDEIRTKVRERILYTCIHLLLQAKEIFSDIDDAPHALKTISSHLQATLQLVDDPLEYDFTLMHFFNYQSLAVQAVGMYEQSLDKNRSKEDIIKDGIISLIQNLREQDDEDSDDGDRKAMIDIIIKPNLIKRVKLVKKSNDFNSYFLALKRWAGEESEFDVDGLLKGIMDEDE